MGIIGKVASLMQSVLGPELDTLGRETKVIVRERKFSGSSLFNTVVLTMLRRPDATTDDFVTTAATLGVAVTPEGMEKRFTEALESYLKEGLDHVLKHVIGATPVAIPLLEKFTAVEIGDSSTVTVPDEYEPEYPSCGGKTGSGKAAVKIQVVREMRGDSLVKVEVGPGRESDAKSVAVDAPAVPGSLAIRDLGYFGLKRFRSIGEQGAFWISRIQQGTAVFAADGRPLDLLRFLRGQPSGKPIDMPILLGVQERLPCRLIALRAPEETANRRRQAAYEKAQKHGRQPTQEHLDWCEWTVFVTNCLDELVTWKEVVVLYRTRWQIELLFKLWKSHGRLADYQEQWSSTKRMALFWAKLIAMILQHWLLLTSNRADPSRSQWKAARVIRDWVMRLAGALGDIDELTRALRDMAVAIEAVAKKKRETKRPSLFQLLLNPELLNWTP